MLTAIQVFAVATIFDHCIGINRVVYTRCNVAGYIGIAGHHDTQPKIEAAPILSHKISVNTKETHCIIVLALTFIEKLYTPTVHGKRINFCLLKRLFLKQSSISILD